MQYYDDNLCNMFIYKKNYRGIQEVTSSLIVDVVKVEHSKQFSCLKFLISLEKFILYDIWFKNLALTFKAPVVYYKAKLNGTAKIFHTLKKM